MSFSAPDGPAEFVPTHRDACSTQYYFLIMHFITVMITEQKIDLENDVA